MKTNLRILLIASLCLCVGWAVNSTIRWTNPKGTPYMEFIDGATKVQLGLRDDGVVVWREITNTTNSPALWKLKAHCVDEE